MKVRITFQSPLTTIGEKGAGCVELLLGTILKGDKGDPGRDEMTAHQVRMALPGSRPTNMRRNKDFPEQKNSSRKHLQACFFTKI